MALTFDDALDFVLMTTPGLESREDRGRSRAVGRRVVYEQSTAGIVTTVAYIEALESVSSAQFETTMRKELAEVRTGRHLAGTVVVHSATEAHLSAVRELGTRLSGEVLFTTLTRWHQENVRRHLAPVGRRMSALYDSPEAQHYVTPAIRNRSTGAAAPVDDLVRRRRPEETDLRVLLAPAGQGKTFLARKLVLRSGIAIPIYVEASQWARDLVRPGTVEETILKALDLCGVQLGTARQHPLRYLQLLAQSAQTMILFDGFDEYVLANSTQVRSDEALRSLAEVAGLTDLPVLVTARTSFWMGEHSDNVGGPPLKLFELRPFDRSAAEAYFQSRFSLSSVYRLRASQIYDRLTRQMGDTARTGFVLRLIADLVSRQEEDKVSEPVSSLDELFKAICGREGARQGLDAVGLDGAAQIERLRDLALLAEGRQYFEGAAVALAFFGTAPLSPTSQLETLRKLCAHPLIECSVSATSTTSRQDLETARWAFRESAFRWHFLGAALLGLVNSTPDPTRLVSGLSSILVNHGDAVPDEVAACMYDRTIADNDTELREPAFRDILRRLLQVGIPPEVRRVATEFALLALDGLAPNASTRERTNTLLGLLPETGGRALYRLVRIDRQVNRLDFSDVEFRDCEFIGTTWLDCEFGERSRWNGCRFERCDFINAHNLGMVQWDAAGTNNEIDGETMRWLERFRRRAKGGPRTVTMRNQDLLFLVEKAADPRWRGRPSELLVGWFALSREAPGMVSQFLSGYCEGSSAAGYRVRASLRAELRSYLEQRITTPGLQRVSDSS